MLGTDDIDLVIRLLEENNWEETQAANAFFAQEYGNDRNHNQTREDTQIDENGVRAPMQ